VLLLLKTETELASEMLCFFKKVYDGQIPQKILSVNIRRVLVSHFFLKMGPKGCPKTSVRIITLCGVLSQETADLTRRFGDAGLGLTLQGPI